MEIHNDAQLYSIFTPIVQDGVQYAIEMALKRYRDYIMKYVYDAGDPEEYDRTYEFLESWETEVKNDFFGAEGLLGQNTDFMTFVPSEYRHGSNISGSVANNLAEILFEGLGSEKFFGYGWWNDKRNAYDEFVKDIETNDRLVGWLRTYLKKYGLYMRKI